MVLLSKEIKKLSLRLDIVILHPSSWMSKILWSKLRRRLQLNIVAFVMQHLVFTNCGLGSRGSWVLYQIQMILTVIERTISGIFKSKR